MIEKAERAFTYKKLVKGLKEGKFKKIVVCTGAGISESTGFPIFSSPKWRGGSELCENLSKFNLPNIKNFREEPEPFYHLAKEFLDPEKFEPTATHYFSKLF